jgi:outer membrane protein assembly factor BamD
LCVICQEMRATTIVFLSLFLAISVGSCTEYNRLLKNPDNEAKKEGAFGYYDEGEWIKAITLLEDIIPFYKLTKDGEKLYFMYCMCSWNLEDFYLAGYYFKRFVRQYPTSKHVEEALFLSAMCSVKNSPQYSLDQTETLNALDEIQIFIDLYPNSSRMDSCNNIMDRLEGKLELKQFEQSYLFYKTENYKAAVVAFESTLEKYPNSAHKEDIGYYLVKSHYLLAMNSIPTKKKERLNNTLKSYRKFVALFPESKKRSEVDGIKKKVEKELEVLEKI